MGEGKDVGDSLSLGVLGEIEVGLSHSLLLVLAEDDDEGALSG